MVKMTFSTNDIPDLDGKVVIVTGANSGIGKETAKELFFHGAHVILACRSKERTIPVINEFEEEGLENRRIGKVEFMELDLSSLDSVKKFTENFKTKNLPLHILVLNAGLMNITAFELSKDNIEIQFATNHLGHFLLTNELLPILEESAPSRIVVVSSMMHQFAWWGNEGICFDGLNDPKSYNLFFAGYNQSKLANILFAKELARRLKSKGIENVYVNSLHPGVISSGVVRNWMKTFSFIYKHFIMDTKTGALTTLYCCVSEEIERKNLSGKYFVPFGEEKEPSKLAQDLKLARKLWDFSVKVIKEKLET
jgi:NAD(P)-dependent dehydrogenase (short-subunit alcohol dehydrogenase family)